MNGRNMGTMKIVIDGKTVPETVFEDIEFARKWDRNDRELFDGLVAWGLPKKLAAREAAAFSRKRKVVIEYKMHSVSLKTYKKLKKV